MTLLRAAATVGGLTMISRVLGFLRDVLIASVLGAGLMADAFFVAFKLPNLFRRLFAEGAFNLAFVPLFAGLLRGSGRAPAKRFAEDALAVLLWALMITVIAAEIAMPWLMAVFAPGFLDEPGKFALTVDLTRLTFPYLLLVSLVSLLAGVLNSMDRFAAAAAAPILLNVCLILAMLGFAELAETPAHALAWGVAGAGVVQFLWLCWNCHRAGMLPSLPRPRLTPAVRHLLWLMMPAALGAGVAQINLLVDMVIASLLPTGAVSYLYYADRIVQLPLGVIGVALGTALLPALSRHVRAGEAVAAADAQNRAIEYAMLLTLPAAVALMLVAMPVITVLFERGAFGGDASAATAAALAAYALGLPAFVLIKVLAPGYFSRQDTRTPVKIAVAALLVNIVLNLALMGPFAHVGIALASAAAAWLNALLLARGLARRGHFAFDERLKRRLPRAIGASLAMALLLAGLQLVMAPWLDGVPSLRALALAVLVTAGVAGFGLMAVWLKAADPGEMRRLLRRTR